MARTMKICLILILFKGIMLTNAKIEKRTGRLAKTLKQASKIRALSVFYS
jgi:hypothetical protein